MYIGNVGHFLRRLAGGLSSAPHSHSGSVCLAYPFYRSLTLRDCILLGSSSGKCVALKTIETCIDLITITNVVVSRVNSVKNATICGKNTNKPNP